ncbi:hypothetical protein [Hyphomicrobium sp. NDB2Meth4]|uniref:hypothetical protein n=1 Tax=Hyphomicrobium sp. NDB2Meth4 TaxID=1892846 RepID=UPI0009308295|nr:hypothetical protein [Hyphomicrobium sp. NDB2Meth4]
MMSAEIDTSTLSDRDKAAIELAKGFLANLAGPSDDERPYENGSEAWRMAARFNAICLGSEPLIRQARDGDVDADQVVRMILRDRVELGEPTLSSAEKDYLIDIIEGMAPLAYGKFGNRRRLHDRDLLIAMAVARIMELGYKATRNPDRRGTNDGHSACSIVHMALEERRLKSSESSVNGIWTKMHKAHGDRLLSGEPIHLPASRDG